nr:hypothetical protein [uncultured Roseateles sp.]
MSDRSLYGLIELLLVFGVVMVWAIVQWRDWRRWRSKREEDDRER